MPKQPETGRTAAIMRSSSTSRIHSRGRVELAGWLLVAYISKRNSTFRLTSDHRPLEETSQTCIASDIAEA